MRESPKTVLCEGCGNPYERAGNRQRYCTGCGLANQIARHRQYKLTHKESIKKQRRGYYLKNADRLIAYSRQWRADNPERAKESRSRYWSARPEQRREKDRRWRLENRDKVLASKRLSYEKLMSTDPERVRRIKKNWKLSNPEKVRKQSRKEDWIMSRLRKMARDDGVWELLRAEYESRKTKTVCAKVVSRKSRGRKQAA